ncbi:unnamed protein product [Cuscuta epithymum]|uniref:AAA+ ATPase domain-containing protein n=1 Tax=Cuscuta epithymum TaxID=186058 RepID=A0AAV0EMS5_9ASTE|nr:unnamed protein product [Cuscuta epithymum]
MVPMAMGMGMEAVWGTLGSTVVTLMLVWATFSQYCPYEVRTFLKTRTRKLRRLFYPYVHISFHELSGDYFRGGTSGNMYKAIERYLAANSSHQAKRLKAEDFRDSQALVLSMDYFQEVTDEFQGIKLWWVSEMKFPTSQTISFRGGDEVKKFFTLKFHEKHRHIVTGAYLKHVLEQGKEISVKDRQRKLYTNIRNDGGYYYRRMWTQVAFEHPATFETIGMDPKKKQEIIDDLITFSKSKQYYAKVGKSWKRGYLLYGPPGTGKSSMVAAMANFLEYDVYDLELTAVKDNTTLRKLLIDTSSKSIIVIEDIDCSLELTGQRKGKPEETEVEDPLKIGKEKKPEEKKSEVTLSGLLNFIDGLWSAIGGERIIVFTTNFREKLDPALIRRGRMDKHIELSYCGFEAFKVLAKNYLDVETHELFPKIERLLTETEITPADVAENLMPKSGEGDETTCLEALVEALGKAKEDARVKAEEDERKKAEEKAKVDAKLKGQEEEDKMKAEEKAAKLKTVSLN